MFILETGPNLSTPLHFFQESDTGQGRMARVLRALHLCERPGKSFYLLASLSSTLTVQPLGRVHQRTGDISIVPSLYKYDFSNKIIIS